MANLFTTDCRIFGYDPSVGGLLNTGVGVPIIQGKKINIHFHITKGLTVGMAPSITIANMNVKIPVSGVHFHTLKSYSMNGQFITDTLFNATPGSMDFISTDIIGDAMYFGVNDIPIFSGTEYDIFSIPALSTRYFNFMPVIYNIPGLSLKETEYKINYKSKKIGDYIDFQIIYTPASSYNDTQLTNQLKNFNPAITGLVTSIQNYGTTYILSGDIIE